MKALDRIDAILTEIERLDAILTEIERRLDKESRGQARQYEDREALDTVKRIERKLKRDCKSKV